jgi:4-hydroxy-tetrahydrodipicolinate reductase
MKRGLHIALIGYGKMGREIEKMALEQGHLVVAVIDSPGDWHEREAGLGQASVAIEFTVPDQAPGNILRCFDRQLPVVCGTTGWQKELPRIRQLCLEKEQALFHSPNFSIGVNLFFEINRRLAGMMAGLPAYRPRITETHHTQKLDAPSGTAVALAEEILHARNDMSCWVLSEQEGRDGELPIQAIRREGVTGTHVVDYRSPVDSIEIRHTAFNRQGFAEGALMAANWVAGKKGVFTMKDMLNL